MPSTMITASLQATALGVLSNICAQVIGLYRQDLPLRAFSLAELFRFGILMLVTSPPNYYWQILLERIFPGRILEGASHDIPLEAMEQGTPSECESQKPEPRDQRQPPLPQPPPTQFWPANSHNIAAAWKGRWSWKNTFLKWFIDCMTMGALLNTVAFLIVMGLLKGKSVGEIETTFHDEFVPIMLASYYIWPVASVVNFTLIAVERRLLFLSAVGLCWNVYMSIVASTL